MKGKHNDPGLETLLSLNGEIFPMDNGYWTKFEAKTVEPKKHIQHGIQYSLTLHNPDNERIIGFDNAHAIKPKRKKFGARKVQWDHKHKKEKTTLYEFENAAQLLEDFWKEVDCVISEIEE